MDTDGFTPPFSFAEDFPAPGLNRVFNYSELTFEIKDGKLQQNGSEYTDMRLALVPAVVDLSTTTTCRTRAGRDADPGALHDRGGGSAA